MEEENALDMDHGHVFALWKERKDKDLMWHAARGGGLRHGLLYADTTFQEQTSVASTAQK